MQPLMQPLSWLSLLDPVEQRPSAALAEKNEQVLSLTAVVAFFWPALLLCPPRIRFMGRPSCSAPALAFWIAALFVLVCILAAVLVANSTTARGRSVRLLLGGAAASTRKARALRSENLVVDTLNLVHWLRRRVPSKTVKTCDILAAIEASAPVLRRSYAGRIVYVTKDRETRREKADAERVRALYQAAAHRHNVYVNVVERLPEDSPTDLGPRAERSHASLGRDDFYLIMLAWKYNCAVLSRDRFRDLADMKTDLESFHVYSYSPAKPYPDRDFVNPAAAEFRRMRRPAAVDYSAVLPHL